MHDKARNPYRYVCNCGSSVKSEQEPCRNRGTAVSSDHSTGRAILTSEFCQEEEVEVLMKGGSDWSKSLLHVRWSPGECGQEEKHCVCCSLHQESFQSSGGTLMHKAKLSLSLGTRWPERRVPLASTSRLRLPAALQIDRSLQHCTFSHLLTSIKREKQSWWKEPAAGAKEVFRSPP